MRPETQFLHFSAEIRNAVFDPLSTLCIFWMKAFRALKPSLNDSYCNSTYPRSECFDLRERWKHVLFFVATYALRMTTAVATISAPSGMPLAFLNAKFGIFPIVRIKWCQWLSCCPNDGDDCLASLSLFSNVKWAKSGRFGSLPADWSPCMYKN